MTPSNPDNQQPLIYRICDAAGVFHLVAPVNHEHTQSEVTGLEAALEGKANSEDMITALASKADTSDMETELATKLPITTLEDDSDQTNKASVSIEPYFTSEGGALRIKLTDSHGDPMEVEITFTSINNLILAVTEMDSFVSLLNGKATKVSGATNNNFASLDSNGNLKDSGKKASDFAEADHTHSAIYGEGAGEVDVNNGVVDVDAPVKFRLTVVEEGAGEQGGDIEHTIEIDYQNIANLARALTTPDSTPTVNSTNLVTSGGVAAAIAGLGSPSVVPHIFVNLTDKINVTQLDNDTVYSVEISGQQTIPDCFTGGTINWIGTKQTDSCDQFLFRYYKVTYGQFGATYHYVEVIDTKNSWE